MTALRFRAAAIACASLVPATLSLWYAGTVQATPRSSRSWSPPSLNGRNGSADTTRYALIRISYVDLSNEGVETGEVGRTVKIIDEECRQNDARCRFWAISRSTIRWQSYDHHFVSVPATNSERLQSRLRERLQPFENTLLINVIEVPVLQVRIVFHGWMRSRSLDLDLSAWDLVDPRAFEDMSTNVLSRCRPLRPPFSARSASDLVRGLRNLPLEADARKRLDSIERGAFDTFDLWIGPSPLHLWTGFVKVLSDR